VHDVPLPLFAGIIVGVSIMMTGLAGADALAPDTT